MKHAQPAMLDSLLKALPAEDRQLVRLVTAKAPTEVMHGEHAGVSWITTDESRENEIVVSRGMNDSHFKLNPIVTNNHAYWRPPVGKSLWRKHAKDGLLVAIKAKTVYPKRPDSWSGDAWMPDTVLALIHAGMMQNKSVGFLRLKSHAPSCHEIAADPDMAKASRVIDECLLIEYAATFLQMNRAALVEAVSKSGIAVERLRAIGIELPSADVPRSPPMLPFTPESELYRAIERCSAGFEFEALAMRAVAKRLKRARGRV